MRMLVLASIALVATNASAQEPAPPSSDPTVVEACSIIKQTTKLREVLEELRLLRRTKELFGSEVIDPNRISQLANDALVKHSLDVINEQRRADEEWHRQFCPSKLASAR